MQSVEPTIVSTEQVVIFLLLPVVAKHLDPMGNALVIGNDNSTVSVGAQILARVETKGARDAKGTGIHFGRSAN